MWGERGTILSRVPNEVLSMIFEHCVDDDCVDVLRDICLTCRSWHALAISLPNLWRFLHLYYTTTLDRVALWVKRSRSAPLSIVIPTINSYTQARTPIPLPIAVCQLLAGEMHRWQFVVIDCIFPDATRRRAFGEAAAGRTATILEEFSLKWSGDMTAFPTCTFPHLRYLTLGRMASRRAELIIPTTNGTLKGFTLGNVQLSDSLRMDRIINALRHCPLLEELQMDEVAWEITPDTENDAMVTLPHLRKLSLTAVSDVGRFVASFRLPKLMELIVGDVTENLTSLFDHITLHTSTLQSLRTGLWEESFAKECELSLLSLLSKQNHLRTLSVREAAVTDLLIERLIAVRDEAKPIVPLLENLELPTRGIQTSKLISMVQSRYVAASSNGQVKRLISLSISGTAIPAEILEKLSSYVEKFEFEVIAEDEEVAREGSISMEGTPSSI